MRNRNLYFTILLIFLSIVAGGCITEENENIESADQTAGTDNKLSNSETDTIYQFSIIDALLEGVYDGEVSCAQLKEKGDFGLGTFDNLDGEMLELDGIIYQVKADGQAYEVEDSVTSPFAAITFFETDIEDTVDEQMDSQQLAEHIETLLPSQNIMYAVKVTGKFDYMKTRSVAAQEQPYPRLVEVTKDQSVFEFNDTEGTIVGYWMPEYVEGMNVPGYHLHFITQDRTAGGHILDYTISSGTVEIDSTDKFYLELPTNDNYLSKGLSQDTEGELEEAEK
ncbi:acetolactate decarboxylase [Methanolobus mangrovi]|uniref:Alpha-acetolactate decarboxylase n=1 Tax=Methanolobus mangrovi TaxID=3072977 RepID=A0AA51UGP5_9EURY|nr:acetolactate decarboxylase [Methanolobus mangrovi]WMW22810.1 acetolactate decarboxylase [Methanolobus mangrovi]